MIMINFFRKKREELCLSTVHNSGRIIKYTMFSDEFNTTLEDERQNLDNFIQGARELLDETKLAERDLYCEFGHNRFRFFDHSAFVITSVE